MLDELRADGKLTPKEEAEIRRKEAQSTDDLKKEYGIDKAPEFPDLTVPKEKPSDGVPVPDQP